MNRRLAISRRVLVLAALEEPRLRILRQENRGVGPARNAALRAARGDLIAFLDSDDEWPPYHLALAAAFFKAFPKEHLFTTEFWEHFRHGVRIRHFIVEMSDWYPDTARRIGSRAFASSPAEDDPLLWFFDHTEPVGAWANAPLAELGRAAVRHYRGALFRHWRWGWLGALQPTVITREALRTVGLFDTSYPVANDFGFLAALARQYATHFITVAGCYKHEYRPDGRPIAEGHLVSGKTSVRFHMDVLRYFEALFLADAPNDPELMALHAFRKYLVGAAALRMGDTRLAERALADAVVHYPGPDARRLLWIARRLPGGAAGRWIYQNFSAIAAFAPRAWYAVRQRRRGI